MADYKVLKSELAKPAYDGASDAAAANAFNDATISRPRLIPAAEIKKLWGRWGVLGMAWVRAQDADLPDQVRAICRSTYDNLMHDVFADLDPAETEAAKDIARYLGALVGAGVLTEEQREATLALGVELVSPAMAIGWPVVTAADIAYARKV